MEGAQWATEETEGALYELYCVCCSGSWQGRDDRMRPSVLVWYEWAMSPVAEADCGAIYE